MIANHDSRILFLLLLNLQWAFVGLTVVTGFYYFAEFFRTHLKRYASYGLCHFGIALMVAIIGYVLTVSETEAIPLNAELTLWLLGLIWLGQGSITSMWELRQHRNKSGIKKGE